MSNSKSVFMCFVWISEQTAIISLYSINWLVFITEVQRVYCAVRTGVLKKIQGNFTLQNFTFMIMLQRGQNSAMQADSSSSNQQIPLFYATQVFITRLKKTRHSSLIWESSLKELFLYDKF